MAAASALPRLSAGPSARRRGEPRPPAREGAGAGRVAPPPPRLQGGSPGGALGMCGGYPRDARGMRGGYPGDARGYPGVPGGCAPLRWAAVGRGRGCRGSRGGRAPRLGAGGAAAPRLPPGGVSRGGGERFVLKMPAEPWVAGRARGGRQEAMPLLRAFSESALHAKELPFGVFLASGVSSGTSFQSFCPCCFIRLRYGS